MNRGDVYQVRFDPIEGSEQSGTRPAVIVTRNAINQSSSVVMVTPSKNLRDYLLACRKKAAYSEFKK